MSDPDHFLARWSRRKREVAEEAKADPPSPQATEDSVRPAPSPVAAPEPDQPAFDLTKLPSIESISADTDISGFLAPGVPLELKTAALRRAWAADPKIRDFVGLNDYDFDFHTPGAIPGFGPLEMTDDLRREVARIVGNLLPDQELSDSADAATSRSASPPSQAEERLQEIDPAAERLSDSLVAAVNAEASPQPASEAAPVIPHCSKDSIAGPQVAPATENLQPSARRSHGGALPK